MKKWVDKNRKMDRTVYSCIIIFNRKLWCWLCYVITMDSRHNVIKKY